MGFSLVRFLEIASGLLTALGIRDVFNLLLKSRVEDWIERRRFGVKEKRDANDALHNAISAGEQSRWLEFLTPADEAHIRKLANKIESFDVSFADQIRLFLAVWGVYYHISRVKLPSSKGTIEMEQNINLQKLAKEKIEELHKPLVKKINKLIK